MARLKAVGIDLGTTYSAMAFVDEEGHSHLLHNEEGDLLTPSVVLFEDDTVVVGKEAKKVSVLKTDRVAACAKRDMGRPVYSKPINGQYFPPGVIQSYILSKLKRDITQQIGPDFQAVITVPAYFDEPRRKATYDAGVMAGLDVLDIVNEPTAAALAFGEDLGYLTRHGAPRQRMNVIVYDLGGGTFDVTLIDLEAGNLRTICTDGDVQLGGHDWDMRLVDVLAERFLSEHGEDPRPDPESFQRLVSQVEEVKHTLSARQRTHARLSHNGKHAAVEVTRADFEQRTADLLERTRFTTRTLLQTAGLQWDQIGRVLLTGGSTRMPMVQRMLKDLTGINPDMTVNPDEAVARGAALYAGYLLASKGVAGHQPTFDVTNVNAHSLGVEGIESRTFRKINTILIPRNTPLPARKTERCVTRSQGQRTVVVRVLEGESSNPAECTPIGRTVIEDLPSHLPQGHPVEVTYEYGVNGRLSVTAVVTGTDRQVHLELEREETLSADQVARWRKTIAGGGGMDSFDLAIQQELEALQGQAPTPSVYGSHVPGVPSGAAAGDLPVFAASPTTLTPAPAAADGSPAESPVANSAFLQQRPFQSPGGIPRPQGTPVQQSVTAEVTSPQVSAAGLSAMGSGGPSSGRSTTLTHPSGSLPPGTPPPGFSMPGSSPPGLAQGSLAPPATHPPGTHPPGTHPPGTHPPGTHPPGTHPPGTQATGTMVQGHHPSGSQIAGGLASATHPTGHLPPSVPSGPASGSAGSAGTAASSWTGGASVPEGSGSPNHQGVSGQPSAEQMGSGASGPTPKKSSSGMGLLTYVVLITLAVMVGYYISVWLWPSVNVLNLNLPGLRRLEDQPNQQQ